MIANPLQWPESRRTRVIAAHKAARDHCAQVSKKRNGKRNTYALWFAGMLVIVAVMGACAIAVR